MSNRLLEKRVNDPVVKAKKKGKKKKRGIKSITRENISALLKKLNANKKKSLESNIKSTKKTDKKTKIINNILKSILDYLPKKNIIKKGRAYGAKATLLYGEPSSEYVDYDKLYSYLGKFKSQGMYENFISTLETDSDKDKTPEIVLEIEKIDNAIRQFKYFTPGDIMMDPALPPMGMSSNEYEKLKIWKQVNYIEYWLKTQMT